MGQNCCDGFNHRDSNGKTGINIASNDAATKYQLPWTKSFSHATGNQRNIGGRRRKMTSLRDIWRPLLAKSVDAGFIAALSPSGFAMPAEIYM